MIALYIPVYNMYNLVFDILRYLTMDILNDKINLVECGYENCGSKVLKKNLKRHTLLVHKKNFFKLKQITGQRDLTSFFPKKPIGKY